MKVPFDSLTLRCVVSELRKLLPGGVVQQFSMPTPTDIFIAIRNHGATHTLLLSCDANTPRAHLTTVKRPNPASPPAFCMACRKHLGGGRVEQVRQREFDRIFEIAVRDREGETFLLIAELMGKHSNVILVREDGRIVDAAKRISRRTSRFREVLPGKEYEAPPTAEGSDPFVATAAQIEETAARIAGDPEAATAFLMDRFQGVSPFLAAEILQRATKSTLGEAWEEIFGAAAREEWSPVLIRNERAEPVGAYPFPSIQFPADAQNPRASMQIALDHLYSVSLPRASADAARRQLRTEIERAITAKRKQAASLESAIGESKRAEEFKQIGELLLANLYRIEPEATSVTAPDYYAAGSPDRTIALDPKLSPQENAEAWFKRYRKARDGAQRLKQQQERTLFEIAGLESAKGEVEDLADLAAVQEMRQGLQREGYLRVQGAPSAAQEKRRVEFEGKKIRTITTPDGWEILVGENSEANDYLTTRAAAPNDIWLHVRANTSAHVVIRTRNQPQAVPASVLQQAAKIAARHSPAKHSSLVPVDYTLRKYVRKPKGSPPGGALYQNEKTLYVTPQE